MIREIANKAVAGARPMSLKEHEAAVEAAEAEFQAALNAVAELERQRPGNWVARLQEARQENPSLPSFDPAMIINSPPTTPEEQAAAERVELAREGVRAARVAMSEARARANPPPPIEYHHTPEERQRLERLRENLGRPD